MLIIKKYKISISNRNKGHFINLGYDVGLKCVELEVDVNDLSIGSHQDVDVQCDVCDSIFQRKYKQYLRDLKLYNYDTCNKCKYEKVSKTNIERYGVSNPFQSEDIKDKIRETNIKRYGFDNPAKNEDIKDKIKQTCMDRYGVEYHLSLPEIRERISKTKSELGLQLPTEMIDDFVIYRNKVNDLTRRVKNELYEEWDGLDYYDNEYIMDNMELDSNDRLYPTVDHKISVYHGFVNGIDEEEISQLSNLCITKRYINSSKHNKNESDFKLT